MPKSLGFKSTLVIIVCLLLAIAIVRKPSRGEGTVRSANPVATAHTMAVSAETLRTQRAAYAAFPLAFEESQGQTDPQVRYLARSSGYTLFLTSTDAVFSLHSAPENARRPRIGEFRAANLMRNSTKASNIAAVHMQLVGANLKSKITSTDLLPGKSNYFLGNDRANWRSNVPRFGRVNYQDVYPGVNMAFHGAQRQPEFDFVVAPGANPAPIQLRFTGNQSITTDATGNLAIASCAGNIVLHKPVAYQENNGTRQAVDARYILEANGQVGFELGDYDRRHELVIDPTVSYAYSTYLGGSAEDDGFAIAFDSSGNAYVTGQTESPNFPATGSIPSNASIGTSFDVFVSKISADGSTLIYSTYIGGSGTGKGTDSGNGIAVDGSGDAFIAGGTESSNFPTTAGVVQPLLGSGATQNAFVLELNPNGNALVYGTYLGGGVADTALGVALDSSGDAYAVGKTSSPDFPLSTAPLQSAVAGGFLTKLAPGAASLVFSTYLGGGAEDFASAVALDPSGNAYVTGPTYGSLTTTSGAYQTTFAGGISDAFVSAVMANGSAYIYSTYLGGSGIDIGNGIAVDSSANAYVTGQTASNTNFPTTGGAVQTVYGGGTYDSFVSKLNSSGSSLVYSTYLGGSAADYGIGIAVDGGGNAYVTGRTYSSSGFPTVNPTQAALDGTLSNAFVTEFNAAGSQLAFSTYLGGSGDQDTSTNGSIAVDGPGATIYVTGSTTSTDFPVSAGAVQKNYGGNTDAFAVVYDQPAFSLTATALTPTPVSPGSSATSTVTLTALNGYSSQVTLSCAVTGTGSPLPTCSASSFQPDQVTPAANPGAASTLTISTTAATSALIHPSRIFYAIGLPFLGLALAGAGVSRERLSRAQRKKLFGIAILGLILGSLFLLPACGGGGSSSGGGGGGGGSTGTPAGNYTVTITGTDSNGRAQSAQVVLAVN